MIDQDPQELARFRAAFAAPDVALAPAGCPSPETIWAAVRGELPPRELRQVLDHTAVCAACAEDWRLAVELDRPRAAATAAARGRVLQGRFGRWRPLTVAAALAATLLVAVGVYRAGDFGPREPTYRAAEGGALRSLLPAEQALPRQAAVLRWSPVPGATAYNVRVSTEDLQIIAAAQDQTATEYRIPESALANLPPGSTLLWQVEAVLPDGTREASMTFAHPLR